MKFYKHITRFTLIMIIVSLYSNEILAQGAPPPPGVPFDFGLSALVAGCIGYGVVKMKNDSKK